MVDDQLGGGERIDEPRIAAHALDGFAHGGQIDDGGHAGEILQQNSRRYKRDLFFRRSWCPVREELNIIRMDKTSVFTAQKVFEKDAERKRQLRQMAGNLLFQQLEPVNIERLRANI